MIAQRAKNRSALWPLITVAFQLWFWHAEHRSSSSCFTIGNQMRLFTISPNCQKCTWSWKVSVTGLHHTRLDSLCQGYSVHGRRMGRWWELMTLAFDRVGAFNVRFYSLPKSVLNGWGISLYVGEWSFRDMIAPSVTEICFSHTICVCVYLFVCMLKKLMSFIKFGVIYSLQTSHTYVQTDWHTYTINLLFEWY